MRDVDVASCDGRTAGPPAQWLDDRFEHGLEGGESACFSALIGAIKTPAAGVHAAWRRFGGVLCTWIFCGFPPGTQQEATSIARLGGKCRGRTLSNDPGEKAVLLRYHRAQKWTLENSRFTTSRFWSEPPVLRGTGRPPQGVSENSAVAETSGRCWGIKDCWGAMGPRRLL